MTTEANARPGAESGTGVESVGETSRQSTGLPAGWANTPDQQWHYEAGWADGYAAGRADAERAIAEEIAQATGVRPYSSRAVIQWLCRSIDLDQRARRPEPYSSPENGTTLGVAERDVIGRWAA